MSKIEKPNDFSKKTWRIPLVTIMLSFRNFNEKKCYDKFLYIYIKNLKIFIVVYIMEFEEANIKENEYLLSNLFLCTTCDYNTSRKLNYDRHMLTRKHKKRLLAANIEQNEQNEQSKGFECICGNVYKYNRGLSNHKKSCNLHKTDKIISNNEITPELVIKIIEQNKELTNIILQQNTTINKLCDNTNNNTNTNITNNTQINNLENNNTFNLNFYLNETCKNAMNIDEFVDSIKLSLEDLEYTGRKGYIEGISNIILKNLKRLGEYDRPIHCSDNKRQILYIKHNNIWNKEDDNKTILTNAIKVIANQNIKQISKWSDQYPDCKKSDSKKNNLYLQILSNSMCGIDKEETDKNIDKIISNVSKHVTINKK